VAAITHPVGTTGARRVNLDGSASGHCGRAGTAATRMRARS
jgi:hypothetical protein